MIIKSMSRKAPTFGQLIGYIGRDADGKEPFASNLYHAGNDTKLVEAQFLENYGLLPDRKNGNALYHEILALEPQSHLSQVQVAERLTHLAQVYCDYRAPGHLAWGMVHFDTKFPHVHLMISSNPVSSNKRRRLSKEQFAEAQRAMEVYAREHYPELNLTPVYTRTIPVEALRKSRAEQEMERRTGDPSRREVVAAMVRDSLRRSTDLDRLGLALQEKGLHLNQRGNYWTIEDMQSSKRYRLRTLGLADMFEKWCGCQLEPGHLPKGQEAHVSVVDPRRAELERLADQRLRDFSREQEGDRER